MAETNGATESDKAEGLVSCVNSQSVELQGTLLRLSPFQATFEVYGPAGLLRTSEQISELKISLNGETVYSGRGVVTSLVHSGSVLICEVALEEAGIRLNAQSRVTDPESLRHGFEHLLEAWGKEYKVEPEFKVVMADMQTFFLNLRLWAEQLEHAVRSEPAGDRLKIERQALESISAPILPAIAPVLEKFEALANRVAPDLQPAHRHYMKRQIHPLVLCSPFLYRTFQKPLGYAGDYEMVRMMARDPYEGGSIFAKVLNRIFLATPPVVAHQTRLKFLFDHLQSETARVAASGRNIRIFNIGCGPAIEIQEFLRDSELSSRAEFTLLDFNEETLNYTTSALNDLKSKHGRATVINTIKKSVHHVLKDAGKPSGTAKYDLVYCAGLFDYLTDPVCKRLTNYMYELVVPGGLMMATNVKDENPSRNWMEYVLDWHLIYRSAGQFRKLTPERAPSETNTVQAIGDGVNIAMVVRKPPNGK